MYFRKIAYLINPQPAKYILRKISPRKYHTQGQWYQSPEIYNRFKFPSAQCGSTNLTGGSYVLRTASGQQISKPLSISDPAITEPPAALLVVA